MEDGLVLFIINFIFNSLSLNPCCSGRWSRTRGYLGGMDANVLILVVVEDGLVLTDEGTLKLKVTSLNPCCSGRWSRTEFVAFVTPNDELS